VISPQTINALNAWGQLLGYFVAVPVAIGGFFKAIYEIRANREQRAEELRWKQAQASKELLDDIHNHELTSQAVHMMDWAKGSAEYKIRDDFSAVIDYPTVLKALAMNQDQPCDELMVYIRDCFDWLFYRVERIEYYIRCGFIRFEDVRDVFQSYARQVAGHDEAFKDFLRFHEYHLAREFFSRFPGPSLTR
jgi:hypothetical protein